ncbi:non-ribosomal peptide synthase/polyketide synthase [Actinomadura nitritigenes]|uniref:non-ribosomal peptide synthase/polyketide synthase n=1 Tax=Actinomadura nitritigenes TaxID=134602 RepID=UPI0036BEE2E7
MSVDRAAESFAGLSSAQQELLRKRLRGEEPTGAERIERLPPESPRPLSFAQQRLWFLNQLDPSGAEYNVPIMLRLRGELDVEALERALSEIAIRHEVLRTTVATTPEGVAIQNIRAPSRLALALVDLSHLTPEQALVRARELADTEAMAPFDLAAAPPVRTKLIRVSPQDHVLSLALHHIVSDQWSAGILHRELSTLYEAFSTGRPSPLEPLPLQYGDYAAWQRRRLSGETLDRHLAYWQDRLNDLPPLQMPTDRPRPAHRDTAGALHEFAVPSAIADGLRQLSRDAGCSMFMTLLAAFTAVLARYTGQDDIAVGTPTAGRTHPDCERLIGFFINTLVLRTDLSGDPEFRDLLARVRETSLEALSHQELPFERLVEVMAPGRDRSRHPLFDVFFSHQAAEGSQTAPTLGGLETVAFPTAHVTTQFDLTLNITETGDGLHGCFEYSTGLFDAATMKRLESHLLNALHAVIATPGIRVSELPLLSGDEREQLIAWSTGPALSGPNSPMHHAIAAQAARTPDRVAVVAAGRRLTFRELDERAGRLARRLRADGAGPETVIAVSLPRTTDLIVALLAVWKTGAAYLPLDPGAPLSRTAFQLTDATASLLITTSELLVELPDHPVPLVLLDDPHVQNVPAEAETDGSLDETHPDNAAYLVYTSGSTGVPKAVTVTHRNLAAYTHHITDRLELRSGADYATLQSLSVDFAGTMLYPALVQGGTVHMLEPDIGAGELRNYLARHDVDYLKLLPTQLAGLIAEGGAQAPPLPRTALVLGGERCPGPLVERFLEGARKHGRRDLVVHNHYGPTETTVGAVTHAATSGSARTSIPIGTPLANTTAHVLDARLRPVPIGVTGELFIGGAQLARGYHDRAVLTAQRFVPDPFACDGTRLYRTGDLVRRLPDGELEFLGRADHQVKVRGHRVEPGEAEAALASHPQVRAAVVVARDDGDNGTSDLVAYIVPTDPDRSPKADRLRDHLRERLPDPMVPARFVTLDSLPLTPSGKVDRAALPHPGTGRPELTAAYIEPATPTEHALADIWRLVLRLDRIGADDDFFELGGHSILATQLVARIRTRFQVDLPVAAVFDAPTLGTLAATIDESTPAAPLAPITAVDRRGPLPLSFAQRRLWFLSQLAPESPAYNVPAALRLTGPLDAKALRRALDEMVARHEVLRTCIVPTSDGIPLQKIHPAASVELPVTDLSDLRADLAVTEARRLIDDGAALPFDLAVDLPLRARLVRLAHDDHILALTLHHIASDEWSASIFISELSTLYGAFREGRPSPLADLSFQYADFATWQRDWLSGGTLQRQLDYWRAQLADLPPLELPTDRPRSHNRDSAGALHHFTFAPEVAAGLKRLSRRAECSTFMTLLAAFAALLARHCHQDDIAIGSPISGRTHPDTERLIGFFVNTLVLRIDLSDDPAFTELLARVRKTALAAYNHQDVPFEHLVEALAPDRDRTRHPLFDVLFSYRTGDEPADHARLPGLSVESFPLGYGPAKAELGLDIIEDGAALRGCLEYSTHLFDDETIENLARRLQAFTKAVVADPEVRLGDVDLRSAAERERLSAWGEGEHSPAPRRRVHELIAAQAAQAPDAIAVIAGDRRMSYRDLDRQANRICRRLLRSGVGRESVVAVCLPRGPELITALLGIWKAGAVYLPLDPANPTERLAYQLADSGAMAVITSTSLQHLVSGTDSVVLDDPSTAADIARLPAGPPNRRVRSANAAYLIYTSGSTGAPKAVTVHHAGLDNLGTAQRRHFGITPADRVLQFYSASFDASISEITLALAGGAALVVTDEDHRRSPDELARHIAEHGVTVATLPPAVLAALDPQRLPTLHTLIAVGENFSASIADRWLNGSLRLMNGYGPTEATVGVTMCALEPNEDPDRTLPIGGPVTNTTMLVLDERLKPVPPGVPGELFLGGPQLARGYHGRPSLTAERFIAAPHTADGSRVYRTGDFARWRADGRLEFLGRADSQIKIRGYRVEPGEVEAALTRHPRIRSAAVIAHGDDAGERRLVAYLTAVDAEGPPEVRELRAFLQPMLPTHMIPGVFVALDEMPLTASGKINRRALPAPDTSRPELATAYLPPGTPTERAVADIWREVLRLDSVGAQDDFFDLGGHSLLAAQVIARIRTRLRVALPIAAIFDAPVLTALAAAIDASATHEPPRPLERTDRSGPLPPSFAQQRLWFLNQLHPESPEYNNPTALRVSGDLDVGALRKALSEVVARHEVLRTTVATAPDGSSTQVVHPPEAMDLPVIDLSDLAQEEAHAEAGRLVDQAATTAFDLSTDLPLRVRLVRLSEREHVLAITTHHSASDRWSAALMYDELAALYEAFQQGGTSPLTPLPVQYADYAAWQRERLSGESLHSQLEYWTEQLADLPPLDLPTDRPRSIDRDAAGALEPFAIPPGTTARLRELGRRTGCTMHMVLLAAFQALLSRHSGQDDVAVGTPVAGRPHPDTERLIGFFINTLVLRTDLGGDPTFEELLARVRTTALDAYAHQDVPFEHLVDRLQPRRDRTRNPLFQVVFDFENTMAGVPELAGLELSDFPTACVMAGNDLRLVLTEAEGGLTGGFEYSTGLFDSSTITRWIGHLQTLLDAVTADPAVRLSQLSLPTPAEIAQLEAWSTGPSASTGNLLAHEQFTSRAAEAPHAIAVVAGEHRLTYSDVEQRANRLAHHLLALGSGPESVIAVCLPRGTDLIVALLAIWKAGAGYLPLDPGSPLARTSHQLTDASAGLLITTTDLLDVLPDQLVPLVLLDDRTTQEAVGARLGTPPGVRPHTAGTAYLIYTSGSTGTPKAVAVHHAGLRNLVLAQRERFGVTSSDRVVQYAPVGFDASISEIAVTLSAGATLVIADDSHRRSPERLAEHLTRHQVTLATLPPALLAVLNREQVPTLRTVVSAGERLRASTAVRWRSRNLHLINAYGPTEATVCATVANVETAPGQAPPIGTPIPNTAARVLDKHLNPVPVGVPGELFVGGAQLARGYHGRPALTAERFVPDPHANDGTRLYRTGDRVRRHPDGQLEYLGRTDTQLKLRGHRIEPGEVEAALTRHPRVRDAVVVPHEDDHGETRLVAYLSTPSSAEPPTVTELRDGLKNLLPDYMVPAAFVHLDALPLTANGKLDRAALPSPGADRPDLTTGYRPPSTPTERELASIWSDVLGLQRVGADDDFFDLGGHSIRATQVIARIRSRMHVDIPIAALFDTPVLSAFAVMVDQAALTRPLPAIEPADRTKPLPLSFAQQRLWFLHQLDPEGANYHVPTTLDLAGALDVEALRRALSEVTARHEVLRTTIELTPDGTAVQRIHPAGPVNLPLTDLSDLPNAPAREEATRLVGADLVRPFDLGTEPPVRARLIRLGEHEHVLALILHHLASDQWSGLIIRRELSELYAAFAQGSDSPLEPLPVQYADYAVWQRAWLSGEELQRQLDYWKRRLAEVPVLDLPTDHPRPVLRESAGALRSFSVPPETAAALRTLSRNTGCSVFMTLLAAFQALLSRYCGQDDVAVGTPVAGRGHADTERLVGFFVNTLVMRTDLGGDPTFADLLGRVRETALGAFAHQDVPFEHLVDVLQPERDRGRQPLFDVMFAFDAMDGLGPTSGTALTDLDLCGFPLDHTTAKFDLTLTMVDDEGALRGGVEYRTRLFRDATIDGLVERFLNLLTAVVTDPGVRLSELDLLTTAEHEQATAWTAGPGLPTRNETAHELIADVASSAPDRTAILDARGPLTYGELDADANRLAHHLQALGARAETPIAVCLDRGAGLVTAALAIWKAGASYLPMDPDDPDERLGFQLTDSGAPVVITRRALEPRLPGVRHLVIDDPETEAAISRSASTPPPCRAHSESAAYLIYTSGSTGHPKAVTLRHAGLRNLILAQAEGFSITSSDRVVQYAAVNFDASISEIAVTLAAGATLVIADAPHRRSPEELAEHLARHHVTVATLPPALLSTLRPDDAPTLQTVISAGERLPISTADRWRTAGVRLINAYGPTETTVCATMAAVEPAADRPPAIGAPIHNTTAFVLDHRLRPVPPGVPGELFVGGAQLARGYHGRPALTAERFVPDPHANDGTRLYRTGDRVRRHPDGQLEYLGRTDTQLKLRGHRIEPGEIEAALTAHPGIQAAAVAPFDDAQGGTRLAAFAVPADADLPPSTAELRAHLKARLPGHMVPAGFTFLDALPLTSSGKIDTSSLPTPDAARPELSTGYVRPRTPTEEAVADIWAELLGLTAIGVHDDFFELGGHSILAVKAVARIRSRLETALPVAALFDSPTVAGLALTVDGGSRSAAPPRIPKADRNAPLALSFAQQRLWFLNRLAPDSAEYNAPIALRLTGNLDLEALRRAFDEVVTRHEVLRTTVSLQADGTAVQCVREPGPAPLPFDDLSGRPADAAEAEARRLVDGDAAAPFDLTSETPLRARLIRLAQDDHVLSLTLHHIASDQASAVILHNEISVLYEAFREGRTSPLQPLTVQYADYAAWQREWLSGDVLRSHLDYWRSRLNDLPVLDLPSDRPRPARRDPAGALHQFTVPAETGRRLRELSREAGCSPFMTFLAAFQTLLSRYSGQDDVAVGSPIAGRSHPDTEPLIGFFVNTLVLRTDLAGDPTFRELLGRVRTTALGAYAHQDLPFENLVDALQPDRNRSHHPLFDVLFSYRRADQVPPRTSLGDVSACGFPISHVNAQFDLTLNVTDAEGALHAAFEYATRLFEPSTIERMASHLLNVLKAVTSDPDMRLSRIDFVEDGEQQRLAALSTGPAVPLPSDLLPETIAAQTTLVPEQVAVVAAGLPMTYQDLGQRSERLARLLRKLGAGPESVVAIRLPRTPDLIVSILACWRAGAAYLPLEPGAPLARTAFQLADAGAALVITTTELLDDLPDHPVSLVLLDDAETEAALADVSPERTTPRLQPDNAAYLIYTSGSTGAPKAVTVTHRNLTAYVHHISTRLGLGPAAGYATLQSLSVDFAATMLFPALAHGATVHLLPSDTDRELLRAYMAEHQVHYLKLLPTQLAALLADDGTPSSLLPSTALVLGGEPFPDDLRAHLGTVAVHNHYGPSETTVGVITHEVPAEATSAHVPIGRPLPNTVVHILDAQLRPVPEGIPGELFIGGAQVTRGYHGRPALTAERFVADPQATDGSRIYRTGDRARWNRDGLLEFLGRTDDQIKIRGHRVEPGEVQAVLAANPAVKATAVVAREDAPGETRLIAYVVPSTDVPPGVGELRAFLRDRLPDHMIPAGFVFLDALPRTSGGKIDRRALPAPGTGRPELATGFVEPVTGTERALADIWRQVLRVDRVGAHDDFFELGGHSILATRVVARVRAALHVEIPVAALFDEPTLAGLALTVDAAARSRPLPPIERVDRDAPLALSFAQQRLWFLNRLEPDSPEYNVPNALSLTGALDDGALRQALNEVVARHEVLRTTITTMSDGTAVQQIRPPAAVDLPTIDLSALPEEHARAEARRLLDEQAATPFDLATATPLRASLIRIGEREHVLGFTLHHIASDEWSTGIFARELSLLYSAYRAGAPSPLPPVGVQYADYAAWQRDRLSGEEMERQMDYWRDRLADLTTVELPTDRPRPAVRTPAGALHTFTVPPHTANGLRRLSRETGCSMFMTLLAAFQALLGRHTGAEDVTVGSPVTGRTHPDTEGLIGFFVNTLVLRTDTSGDPPFNELLGRVRKVVLDAFAHQDMPFDHLVDTLQPKRDRGRHPLFQVMFGYATGHDDLPGLDGLDSCGFPLRHATSKFELTLNMTESGGALHGAIEYSTDLFDLPTVERLAAHLTTALDHVAADPEVRLSEIDVLPPAEREQLDRWSTGARHPRRGILTHDLIAATAAAAPDATAVISADGELTYQDLDRRANQLAHHLAALGAGPESVVAVALPRGPDLVTALLAVWKAGAAYLPLDPGSPPERLAFQLDDAAATALITIRGLQDRIPWSAEERLITVDDPVTTAALRAEPMGMPRTGLHPENAAYLIYTSGSTGTPKAVVTAHRNLANRLLWQIEAHRFGPSDRVLHHTPPTFDVSLWELCGPLIAGGAIVIAPPGADRDPAALARTIRHHAVTAVDMVPSLLGPFLDATDSDQVAGLRLITCGGEPFPASLARRCHDRLGRHVAVHNLYGPTEASIDVTSSLVPPNGERPPAIGRPHANTACRVLDASLRPVPVGVAGELYIAGSPLGRGYHGRPALTAERFIADPFSADGTRLYRTGDRARLRADGELEFLGRLDDQLKIRGHRIEPGEIETVLSAHPSVRTAVVLALEDEHREHRLVAYVVADGPDAVVDGLELRDHLRARVPEPMIPALFVVLTDPPRTASGKIDRAALPAPGSERPDVAASFVPPRTATEQVLTGIWQQVLGVDRVGVHDDFFELGGDSILSLQIVARAAAADIVITPAQMFDHPTVAELAAVAETHRQVAAEQDRLTGPVGLLPIHHWWARQCLQHPQHFNQATWIRVPHRVDPLALERAATALSDHHDALRLRATGYPDSLQLTLADQDPPLVTRHELPPDLDGSELQARLAEIAERAQTRLDLEAGPIWRLELVDQGPDRGARILAVVHHLAIDTVSWRIFTEDLSRAYEQLASGDHAVDLGRKTTSIRQWAEGHAERSRTTLDRPVDADALPIDHSTGPVTRAYADTHAIHLDADETRALIQQAPAAYRTRVNDLLLTTLSQALHSWAGVRRAVVELEGHGRTHTREHDLSRTIGWFTTFTPVLLTRPENADLGGLIKAVKEQLRAAAHDDGPSPDLGEGPAAQIGFNYHGRIDLPAGSEHDDGWRRTDGPTGTSQHPDTPLDHLLEISGTVTDDRLHLYITYPTTRYRAGTIRALGQALRDALSLLLEHTSQVARTAPGAATPSDFPLAGLTQRQIDHLVDTTDFRIEDAYPLSPMQQGMLFHTLVTPDSGAYFEQSVLTFEGPLDPDLLRSAFQSLTDRHPALRTAVRHHDQATPLQLLAAHADMPFTVQDWTQTPAEEHDALLADLLTADRAQGFDLMRPPLARLTLIRQEANRHTLVLSEHHLLLDGWSQPILLGELQATYQALAAGKQPELPARRPYRDYIAWLADQDPGEGLGFWARELEGFTTTTPLATEPTGEASRHASYRWQLSEDLTGRISDLALTRHLTLNTVIRGALALLIAHRTGSGDVCYGATVAGRPDGLRGVEHMLGLFINTVPVRSRPLPGQTVLEFLDAVQAQQLEQQPYQHTSLADVQRASEAPADTPLFDTLLIFESYPRSAVDTDPDESAVRICDSRTIEYDHYPLTLVTGPGAPLRLTFSFDRSRLTEAAVRRMADEFTALLESMVDDPARSLSDIPLVPAVEQATLRNWGAGPARSLPDGAVIDWIEDQAATRPEATAVITEGAVFTYAELEERANRLAHHLRSLGAGPERAVAVLLDRSFELVVSLLAIWKAGATYLPLEPDGPPDRLLFQMADSAADTLITTTALAGRLPAHGTTTLLIDDQMVQAAVDDLPSEPPDRHLHAHNAAYLLYTSGSTGTPKAVTGHHGGLANRLHWQVEAHEYTADDRVLHKNPTGFDASLWELCCPLIAGAAIVMAPPGAHRDPGALSRLIDEHGVTVAQFVASLLGPFLDVIEEGRCSSLRLILCSGESVPGPLARRWYDRLHEGARLRIGYGPTEASIGVTDHPLDAQPDPDRTGPIGMPVANTTVAVLDEHLRMVPIGAPGELFIGGPQLARGYHGRPALTAGSFIPDPRASDGSRLYRTGDRARWRPDGRLEFLGRTDHQVKIRGQRVEPLEIEGALNAHPQVRTATVRASQGAAGEPRLDAYIVPANPDEPPSAGELRRFLRARLPDPMVPSTFTHLSELPMGRSGKVDRRALPSPEAPPHRPERFRPPSTETERRLALIWQEVLGVGPVSADDDFFELGGHSLHAFRISARTHIEFGVDLPIAAVFDTPTLAGLAQTVEVLRWARDEAPPAHGDGGTSTTRRIEL